MKDNLTQAGAIPSLTGGSAYKGSVRYKRWAGLHPPIWEQTLNCFCSMMSALKAPV